MKDFTKHQARLILDNYDILDTLKDEDEMRMLDEQNPELSEAMYALHRFAYGNKHALVFNERKDEEG